jgi:hypothetical protein
MLKAGDLFAVRTKGFIGWAIRIVQWFWSTDNEAPYNHAGVITNDQGGTLESRLKFGKYRLDDYVGSRILIARHKNMTKVRFISGYDAVKNFIGCYYPIPRLFLHLGRLGKFLPWGPGVCSEMTGKFMKGAGFNNIVYGLTPDDLADKWRIDKDMMVVYEGVFTADILKFLKAGVL